MVINELQILETIDWQVTGPHIASYLGRYSAAAKLNRIQMQIAYCACERLLLEYRMIPFPPSLVAASVICMTKCLSDTSSTSTNVFTTNNVGTAPTSSHINSMNTPKTKLITAWTKSLCHYTGYEQSDLYKCIHTIRFLFAFETLNRAMKYAARYGILDPKPASGLLLAVLVQLFNPEVCLEGVYETDEEGKVGMKNAEGGKDKVIFYEDSISVPVRGTLFRQSNGKSYPIVKSPFRVPPVSRCLSSNGTSSSSSPVSYGNLVNYFEKAFSLDYLGALQSLQSLEDTEDKAEEETKDKKRSSYGSDYDDQVEMEEDKDEGGKGGCHRSGNLYPLNTTAGTASTRSMSYNVNSASQIPMGSSASNSMEADSAAAMSSNAANRVSLRIQSPLTHRFLPKLARTRDELRDLMKFVAIEAEISTHLHESVRSKYGNLIYEKIVICAPSK